MTRGNTVNVTFSNSHLDELKSGIKIGTEVTLKLSSNIGTLSFSDCTKKHFFSQMFRKDGLSKKIALEYNLSCIISKDNTSFS